MNTTATPTHRIGRIYGHVLYHAHQLSASEPRFNRQFHMTALVSNCSALEDLAAKTRTPLAEKTAKTARLLTRNALRPATKEAR